MTAIKVEGLQFRRKQHVLFQDLSLSLHDGKFIALLGKNGTGKSTLLKLLTGLLRPDHGEIMLQGQSLHKLSALEIARLVTYMPQSTNLETNFTVEQVVKMGRYPHKKRFADWNKDDSVAVEEALHFTNIAHLKERYVPSLSGGERQLVYLAKAIAQQTPILLLDEPTSDLDVHHQLHVTYILHTLVQQGKTVVAAIHDINLASRICDECLFLRDGMIVDYGKNEDVMNEENIIHTFAVKSYIYEEQFTHTKQMIPYEVTS